MVKIGIIGGSGLDDPKILKQANEIEVKSPYGPPTSALTCGQIDGVEVVILARHGKDHSIYPSKVNFRANIWALKEQGCTHILASTAVGSLREEIAPGHLVFADQFISKIPNQKYDDIKNSKKWIIPEFDYLVQLDRW